mgnify:CR=1 FL=1
MKKYLLTLSLLPLAVFNSQAHAAKIYTCEVNGSIVYTRVQAATAKPSMIYRLSANTAAADTTLRLVMRRHSMHRHHKRLRQKAKIRLQNPTIRQHPNLPLSVLLLKRLLLRFQNPPASTAAALFWKPSCPMNARLWPMLKSN